MAGGEQRWRDYRVVRRVRESEAVQSLYLAPVDGQPLPAARPGQFMTFRITDATGRPVARNYSISSAPGEASHFRISIRHDEAQLASGDKGSGIGASFMHNRVTESSVLQASAPKGDFRLDEESARPVILLAGGIGITPLLAMAHALARAPGRPTYLIHSCRNGSAQAFRNEIRELCAGAPHIKAFTCLTRPKDEDRRAARHQAEGRITPDILRSVLPIGDYDAYLCGPPGFMQAMFGHLLQLGVREKQITWEFFGPVQKLLRPAELPATTSAPDRSLALREPAAVATGAPVVTFGLAGRTVAWDAASGTLLDFAEANGLTPAFSCRNGICNTCLCAAEGNVTYVEEPLEQPEQGYVLLCCSIPDGPLRLNL